MEFPLPHDPAHIAASENKQAIEDIVFALAEEAGADRPRELARELCLIIEGTYVTRHVTGNKQAADIARSIANRAIEAACPSAKQAG